MDFDYSPKVRDLQSRLKAFMDANIYPNEEAFHEEVAEGDRWQPTRLIEALKVKARAAGLGNAGIARTERGGIEVAGVEPAVEACVEEEQG